MNSNTKPEKSCGRQNRNYALCWIQFTLHVQISTEQIYFKKKFKKTSLGVFNKKFNSTMIGWKNTKPKMFGILYSSFFSKVLEKTNEKPEN